MQESVAGIPSVVMVAPQLTGGGLGTLPDARSMWKPSLQTLTTCACALHAYCAGCQPVSSGPKTSAGRRQMPPASHVHGASPAARCGQSADVEHTSVQPPTTMVGDSSHAAGAMHPAAAPVAQGSSAFTQISKPCTVMQP